MAQKWLINNGQILISASVGYHSELAKDHSTTRGGGLWFIQDNNLYLYGKSMDYGAVSKELLIETISKDWIFQERFANMNIYFSDYEHEFLAMKEAEKLEITLPEPK